MATATNISRRASETGVWRWMVAAAVAAMVVGAAAMGLHGAGRAGSESAVYFTGRLAFLFFWPSYAGSALATLFGPWFQPVKRHARAFGLGFASVIAVHLCLVGRLYWIGDAPPFETLAIFGVAAAWVAALAAASTPRVARAIGPPGWWVLNNLGMNYIAGAFALDFLRVPHPLTLHRAVEDLPFAALAVLGPLLRLSAWLASFAVGAKSAAISPRKG